MKNTWTSGFPIPERLPLVLRGARQVGKTWLVRDLAARSGRDLVELNFERDPQHRRFFQENDPRKILGELSLFLNREIEPGKSLLFLDEIQAAGELLAKLRWFHEEMPELPVAAGRIAPGVHPGGSQLQHAGRPHRLPPRGAHVVSRVPGSARGGSSSRDPGPPGGLELRCRPWRTRGHPSGSNDTPWWEGCRPVVAADVAGREPRECRDLQRELVATYRADFARYSGRMDRYILDAVLSEVAGSPRPEVRLCARRRGGAPCTRPGALSNCWPRPVLCHLVRCSIADGLPSGLRHPGAS